MKLKKSTKSNIEFSGLPTLFQDAEKKDNKARTFAPADIDKEIDKLNKINNFDEMVRNKEDEFDKMFKEKKID